MRRCFAAFAAKRQRASRMPRYSDVGQSWRARRKAGNGVAISLFAKADLRTDFSESERARRIG